MAQDKAAFGVFPQMKPKRSKQDREAAKNFPIDVARGFVSGTLGMPGDIESLARLPYELYTGNESPTILPTSSDIEKRLPLRSESPLSQAATGLGQIGGGFYTGPLSGARAATAVPKAVMKAGKDFIESAGQTVSPLTVYHGSPHKFAPTPKNPLGEFDASKIGTGEGAQAYGHGLYLAETPDVAKTYQPRSPKFEEKLIGLYQRAESSSNYPMMEVLEDAMLHRTPNEIIQKFSNVEDGYSAKHAKAAQDFAKWYSKNEPEIGGLYTVDLPDEKIARMLDWDKPLSEQESVKAALNAINKEIALPRLQDAEGAGFAYQHLANAVGGPQNAAALLREAGIPGVKYLDEQSRGATGTGKWKITMKNGEQKIYDFKPNDDVLEQMGATAEPFGTSNFVVFPGEEEALTILERKKEGGKVSISDNADSQMMDVLDKKMAAGGAAYNTDPDMSDGGQIIPGPAFAVGGAVAKLVKAAKAAKAEPSLPLNLPRAAAKTKEEIRPAAQRMAEQMTGEFVRPDPKKYFNPAGKSFKQFQMERELSHDIRPTEGRTLLPQDVADIEKQQGMLKIGVSGDTTIADKTLYRAGPYELDLPSPQHGGPLYGLGGEGAWASNNPIAANFQKRVQELSQANKDAPVLGQFLAMGPQGSNFALHFADANLRAIDPSKMSKRQVEQFNKLIREGTEKSGPRPGFPGIEDKDSAYLHFAFDPELRKRFNELMQLPKYTEKLGLPDGRIILHAITEPELRNTEVLTSGLSQMRLDPGVNPADLVMSAHPTYSHVIPKVPESSISRTKYPVPAELEFPDVAEFIKKNYRPQDATRVYQTATPRQIIDPQHIDEMKMYEELMKEYTGKKAGGEVQKAGGGAVKAGIKEMMERIANRFGGYEARRLERAADEVPNLETIYAPEGLEKLFNGDNAKGVMTMRPEDFEKFSNKLPFDPKARKQFPFDREMDEKFPQGISQEDYIKYLSNLKGGFSDVPFLEFNTTEFGKKPAPFVSGHEGRHRSRALVEAGQPTGLVQFLPRSNLREPMPRRSREEYLKALNDELEMTNRMVRPQKENPKDRPRPLIQLPPVYKDGGAVNSGLIKVQKKRKAKA